MSAYVALLRAVNVGGRNAIAMRDLRRMLEQAGLEEARTLLQSGNVVFRATRATPAKLESLLETQTEKRLGVRTNYVVRSAAEWDAIVAGNPYAREAQDDPGRLVVYALKRPPATRAADALHEAIAGPEYFALADRHAYIVYPEGQGRSKLTAAVIDRALGVRGTARNWNTVLKLQAMVQAAA